MSFFSNPSTAANATKPYAHVGGIGLIAFSEYGNYREKVKNGSNPVIAGAQGIGSTLLFTQMGMIPAMIASDALNGFPTMRALGRLTYNTYTQQRTWHRQVRTPFSHRFEHTDSTLAAQQRGMQALGMARGYVGSEAGMMAQRYSRR